MPGEFVPFLASLPDGVSALSGKEPAAGQPTPAFQPKLPASASPSPAPPGPTVTLKREGDRVTQIQIRCRCGEIVELDCVY